jgi:hypothetical protein
MKIDIDDVRDGHMDGEVIWVCDYRREDLHKKATRVVRPTRVLVRPFSELPKNKTIYYSRSFLSPIGATGTPLAKVIAVVDNTGYRFLSGNCVHAYTTEAECVSKWNGLLSIVIARLLQLERSAAEGWRAQKKQLIGELK